MAESLIERLRRRSSRHFESRLPAFDPRKTNGVLSDAVRAVYRDPATAAFADTLDHRRLSAGWEDDPHIQRLAADAWQAPDRYNSPFFRAWIGRSRLVGPDGLPLPLYHGSTYWGQREFTPGAWTFGNVVYPTGTWTAEDPRTPLSYLLRPSNPNYFDEMNNRIKSSTALGLTHGASVRVPGLDKLDAISLAEHYGVNPNSKSLYTDVTDKIWLDLSLRDWLEQRDYLDKYYTPNMGTHVPATALEHVVRMHPNFENFYDANRSLLHRYDMDYDARGSNRELIGPFTTPDVGEIYPLFVKSERPFAIGSYDLSPSNWFDTPEMYVDAKSLSPNNLDKLRSLERNSILDSIQGIKDDVTFPDDLRKKLLTSADEHLAAIQGPDYNPTHFSVRKLLGDTSADVFTDNPPTDGLVGFTRLNGVYDGVLTRNVRDGGGLYVPPTNTFAFFDTSQAKSRNNLGTFSPNLRDILRTAGPAMLGGGVLAAAMGRPTGAAAATLPSGWVPPSAKAELEGMEPSGWMDPVNWLVDAATAGGGAAVRAGQAALGAAQDWLGEQVPQIPEVPEEYYEAAQ